MNGDTAGWIYLNLGRQAWVVSSMRAGQSYSVDVEAAALGNGCSPAFEAHAPIGPAPNLNVAPGPTNNDDTCDIAVLLAATLLLPWFEVDTRSPTGENTLITVTNLSAAACSSSDRHRTRTRHESGWRATTAIRS